MFNENKIIFKKAVEISRNGETETATLARRKQSGTVLIVHDYHPVFIPQKDWGKHGIIIKQGGA